MSMLVNFGRPPREKICVKLMTNIDVWYFNVNIEFGGIDGEWIWRDIPSFWSKTKGNPFFFLYLWNFIQEISICIFQIPEKWIIEFEMYTYFHGRWRTTFLTHSSKQMKNLQFLLKFSGDFDQKPPRTWIIGQKIDFLTRKQAKYFDFSASSTVEICVFQSYP